MNRFLYPHNEDLGTSDPEPESDKHGYGLASLKRWAFERDEKRRELEAALTRSAKAEALIRQAIFFYEAGLLLSAMKPGEYVREI